MRFVDFLKILLATFLWGSSFSFVKLGLVNADPLGFAGIRFTIAGFMLLAAAVAWQQIAGRGESRLTPASGSRGNVRWGYVALIGVFTTFVAYAFFFMGMVRTSATSAALIDGAGPIISSVMAHFVLHNDRLDRRKAAAILLAFAGIAFIALARPQGDNTRAISMSGCLLILVGIAGGSIGTMLVINYRGALGLVKLVGYQHLFGGVMLLAAAAAVGEERHWAALANPRFLAIVTWLALVSAVAFRLWYGIVRRYKVTSVSVYAFITTIWGTAMSVVLVGESPTPAHAAGGVLVVVALLLMRGRNDDPLRSSPTPPSVA